MKSCCGRLGHVCKLLHFTQHVSVVLLVEHHEKLCLVVPSSEAGTVLLLKMCCLFSQWHILVGFSLRTVLSSQGLLS